MSFVIIWLLFDVITLIWWNICLSLSKLQFGTSLNKLILDYIILCLLNVILNVFGLLLMLIHRIMLDVLQQRFDVHDAALDWFTYFADRTQVVVSGDDSSLVSELRIGAPQGSVLGPGSFVVHAEDVTEIFHNHRVRHHLFTDDMQGTRHSKPSKLLPSASSASCSPSARPGNNSTSSLGIRFVATRLL